VCRFFGRCPKQVDRCQKEAPLLRELRPGHFVACHFT
jgi:oligopeptide transport system ATP-binding protein